jgi:hypothetical protein
MCARYRDVFIVKSNSCIVSRCNIKYLETYHGLRGVLASLAMGSMLSCCPLDLRDRSLSQASVQSLVVVRWIYGIVLGVFRRPWCV